MSKLRINMFARGQDVPGQGVGSAYHEQVDLLQNHARDALEVVENESTDGHINHFNTVDPLSYLRCRQSQVPSVMHVHFLPETLEGSIKLPSFASGIFKNYVLSFYHQADHLVVVNPTFIEELVKYGLAEEKITYIPNYVSREDFHKVPRESLVHLYDQHGLTPDLFTVLGVGQVQTRKGILDFIKVAESLPQYQFVWCGGFSFGKITDGYSELKEAMDNLPDNVTFTGIVPRDQMNLYYNLADCLFMPSYNELFPMAILEASNVHLPILVRDLALYEDILFGHVLTGDDVTSFSKALTSLAENTEIYDFWANETAEIEKFYSADHVSKIWIDFYQKVVRKATPSMK
jgi:1,2-diacylglycerol-3-alpha-glucose alpha-1,2-galactosyltransferase